MLGQPEIIDVAATPFACVHLTIPLSDMPQQFGSACHELFGTLAAQGITATGPVTAHHLRRPNATFDFEVGVAVDRAVQPTGRVEARTKPTMRVVRTIYQGSYEGLPAAWGEFQSWLEAQDYKLATDFWETYLVGPASSPNAADWRTEFARPLLD